MTMRFLTYLDNLASQGGRILRSQIPQMLTSFLGLKEKNTNNNNNSKKECTTKLHVLLDMYTPAFVCENLHRAEDFLIKELIEKGPQQGREPTAKPQLPA